ncbi:MAG: MOSC domain-containing protein [Sandaracinaceae bacterium]|nr:MOSC domain-containing protein [Sandaracinaceae bacterium]
MLELPDVSLVALPEDGERVVDPRFGQALDRVGFADAYPVLLMGDSSVRDLEARTGTSLDMRRFRPNVTFEGAPYARGPHGGVSRGWPVLRGCSAGDCCVLTTLHPRHAERGSWPRTLAG